VAGGDDELHQLLGLGDAERAGLAEDLLRLAAHEREAAVAVELAFDLHVDEPGGAGLAAHFVDVAGLDHGLAVVAPDQGLVFDLGFAVAGAYDGDVEGVAFGRLGHVLGQLGVPEFDLDAVFQAGLHDVGVVGVVGTQQPVFVVEVFGVELPQEQTVFSLQDGLVGGGAHAVHLIEDGASLLVDVGLLRRGELLLHFLEVLDFEVAGRKHFVLGLALELLGELDFVAGGGEALEHGGVVEVDGVLELAEVDVAQEAAGDGGAERVEAAGLLACAAVGVATAVEVFQPLEAVVLDGDHGAHFVVLALVALGVRVHANSLDAVGGDHFEAARGVGGAVLESQVFLDVQLPDRAGLVARPAVELLLVDHLGLVGAFALVDAVDVELDFPRDLLHFHVDGVGANEPRVEEHLDLQGLRGALLDFVDEVVFEHALEFLHFVGANLVRVADLGADVLEVQDGAGVEACSQEFVGCEFVEALDDFVRVLDLLLQEVQLLDADLLLGGGGLAQQFLLVLLAIARDLAEGSVGLHFVADKVVLAVFGLVHLEGVRAQRDLHAGDAGAHLLVLEVDHVGVAHEAGRA